MMRRWMNIVIILLRTKSIIIIIKFKLSQIWIHTNDGGQSQPSSKYTSWKIEESTKCFFVRTYILVHTRLHILYLLRLIRRIMNFKCINYRCNGHDMVHILDVSIIWKTVNTSVHHTRRKNLHRDQHRRGFCKGNTSIYHMKNHQYPYITHE